MEKNKILAIVGSLRKGSLNRQLALIVKEIIGDRADFELLEYDDVPLMNEDIEFPAPEPVKRVREKVKSADAIWFFTPEHNHFFPSALKNVIDWLSRGQQVKKNLRYLQRSLLVSVEYPLVWQAHHWLRITWLHF